MPLPLSANDQPLSARLNRALEGLLGFISLYVVPIGIALLSLVALVFWNSQYVAHGDRPLSFRVLSEMRGEMRGDSAGALTPQAALQALADAPDEQKYDTKLSQLPVWFVLTARDMAGHPGVLEFPSRHALELSCWDANSLAVLGSASRATSSGALSAAKAGFALTLERTPASVLCRGVFAGPARLSVVQWPRDQFAISIQQYHRKSGLLDGGMIVLTLFVLTTALINRQKLYVLFAAWLILNLRVGALSAGWDIQWLGQTVPDDWLLLSRAVTIALYSIATLTLYQNLFREHLAETRFRKPLLVAEWCCIPYLASALLLPYKSFLPIMWVAATAGLLLMTLGLVSIIMRSRTRVAFWFAASFGVTFISTMAEVASAALAVRELLEIINSVTAALASSLLAALAVAEQMRLETEQRIAAQAELEHTYEAMPVGLFTLDRSGAILGTNPALRRMLGTGDTVPANSRWREFFADGVWGELYQLVHAQADAELHIRSRDGTRDYLVRATLARGKIEGVLQDITEQNKATEQLRFMANNDSLTKVFNRRGIERVFAEAVAGIDAANPLALAYLDLDRFKLINDLFGHGAGDEVLVQVCERINGVLTGGQQVGRVGGDEFVIIMPDLSIPVASMICHGIVERIGNTPYRVGDKAFHVRGSIGLIEVVSAAMPMKDAVSTADRACREAKGGNTGGLVVYERSSSAFQEREAELNLVAQLAQDDATAGMFLEMQPIMSLKSPHDSLNVEVLLRMRRADGSVLQAGPIIGAAEKSGRAGVIDRWVLANTLDWIDTHVDTLVNTQFVCMNLSGASLNDERFLQDTISILRKHAHVANRLCMEITESVALHDLNNTRRFIDQVRNFGVKVALDDFGAGYTSFSYLKELPADVIKIDGNFIVNINAHPANVAIVEAIVRLAVNLGMKTIAEWAEDTATVRTLAEIGVDYVQGWAVARSMAPEKILAASSSASFIQDEQLLQLTRMLASPLSAFEPLAPLTVARVHDLH